MKILVWINTLDITNALIYYHSQSHRDILSLISAIKTSETIIIIRKNRSFRISPSKNPLNKKKQTYESKNHTSEKNEYLLDTQELHHCPSQSLKYPLHPSLPVCFHIEGLHSVEDLKQKEGGYPHNLRNYLLVSGASLHFTPFL